jgi:hypothetical protein
MSTAPVNILCLKWGTLYGPHYVNRLLAGVKRHLKRPFLFHCCTDDATGLDPEVRIIPFPKNPGITRHWPDVLVKLAVFQDGFGGLVGPTIFMDLDVAIMDDLAPFFDHRPGEYCIIHNWPASPIREWTGRRIACGNSSVFRFEAGKSGAVYETFLREMADAQNTAKFNTEQAFMTHAMAKAAGGRLPAWWPDTWCRSYKRHCRRPFPLNLWLTPPAPKDCRILVFHGRPNPDEAIAGYRGKKIHHHMLAAPWIAGHWHE